MSFVQDEKCFDYVFVIPVYNEENFVADTLSHLEQRISSELSRFSCCILVVDNGSTDTSSDVVIGLSNKMTVPLYQVYFPVKGVGAARKYGNDLSAIRAIYHKHDIDSMKIINTDADTFIHEGVLSDLACISSDIDIASGECDFSVPCNMDIVINNRQRKIREFGAQQLDYVNLYGSFLVIKPRFYISVGGFVNSYWYNYGGHLEVDVGEDFDFGVRLVNQGVNITYLGVVCTSSGRRFTSDIASLKLDKCYESGRMQDFRSEGEFIDLTEEERELFWAKSKLRMIREFVVKPFLVSSSILNKDSAKHFLATPAFMSEELLRAMFEIRDMEMNLVSPDSRMSIYSKISEFMDSYGESFVERVDEYLQYE
nr:glycosyltransferase family A protein [Vibrio splendidus]